MSLSFPTESSAHVRCDPDDRVYTALIEAEEFAAGLAGPPGPAAPRDPLFPTHRHHPDEQDTDERLARARTRIEGSIVRGEGTPDDRLAALDILIRIDDATHHRMALAIDRMVGGLSRIRAGIEALYELSPAELVTAVPQRLIADVGLDRAMMSAATGSVWAPKSVSTNNPTADRAFVSFVTGARIPLRKAPVETEMIRRRIPQLITNTRGNDRVYRDIVEVSGSPSYVGAPVVSQGRVVAMLHGDRTRSGSLTAEHLEMLQIYARCTSVAYESARLRARMRSVPGWADSIDTLRQSLGGTGGAETDGDHGSGRTTSSRARPPIRPVPIAATPPKNMLTARERQVIAHICTGATNRQIARALAVSEQTVKSHLKRIFKKLGATTRAEAIALYAETALTGSGTVTDPEPTP
ncbi:hypothetical protein GII33_19405 [Gordonia pseudamarae]|jgi:DNA-binding CsgD family transcriptional regulator|uniref:HTH luxR-type domain-containing protein n=1 Tax=Gordonia pseudamarae TaxID=2831662 RepID=A0ABX6IN37_9ACTN|nr:MULTISPECIES: LuxR C-terminal-related transcriptional regulator [Gordonia]MBD0020796.1 hypothetical protein [Gordonia sp. (in: high G+C Gram-positive bacteria)]QHN27828.1 hypothetical protein GII33_19405 [Gordonia pseudamarae]QHN36710.1 hypothetical protein GII31_19185 [Gordonia pseudamarae]